MIWQDEGFLLSKNNYNENSIIIDVFTLNHGKYTGVVYGGSSRKHKRNFQIGNKILLNWKSKNLNRTGYFSVELIEPISPFFFDNKMKTTCILSATSILKILLPDRQTNKKIYINFDEMLINLKSDKWIVFYLKWELLLIKELGFEDVFNNNNNDNVKKSLKYNKQLLMDNFIIPNGLKFPLFRNILEDYFT